MNNEKEIQRKDITELSYKDLNCLMTVSSLEWNFLELWNIVLCKNVLIWVEMGIIIHMFSMDGVGVSRIAFYGDSDRSKRSEQERVCPKTEERWNVLQPRATIIKIM